jgi:hypothetical protein
MLSALGMANASETQKGELVQSRETEHPSSSHKEIAYFRRYLSELVLYPDVPDRDENETRLLHQGEKDYHSFMRDLYEDMYENAEAYSIPSGEYDKFMDGRSTDELSKSSREYRLRNRFKQSIRIYQRFLYGIGSEGAVRKITNHLVLDRPSFEKALRGVSRHVSQLKGEVMNRISALSRLGFVMDIGDEEVSVSNETYPAMFVGLSALCKSGNKAYHYTHFLRCDYRGLDRRHKPGIEDVLEIVPGEFRRVVHEIDKWMKEMGARVEIKALHHQPLCIPWKVSYKIRGKAALGFKADAENLDLYAYFNSHKNIVKVAAEIGKESDQLCKWFAEHIPERVCACKSNKLVHIGSTRKRICGLMNRLEIRNPDEAGFGRVKAAVSLYHNRFRNA